MVSHPAFFSRADPVARNQYLPSPIPSPLPVTQTDFKRVAYNRRPSFVDPLGSKVSKKWGRKMYHGALLERFDDKDEGLHYRGIYEDGEVRPLSIKYVGIRNVKLEDGKRGKCGKMW